MGRRWAVGVTAAGVLLAETLLVSPAPWPIPQAPATPSAAAARLADGRGPVLELPFATPEGRFWSEVLLDQTVHGRPVPFRLEGRGLQAVHPAAGDHPFFRAAHAWSVGQGRSLPCADARRLGQTYPVLVLHPGRLPPEADGLAAALARCLGPPTDLGDALAFSLEGAG